MSIKNGAGVAALFNPRSQLVDQNGVPTTAYGQGFLRALNNRTGIGTGIVPIVSNPVLTATGSSISNALQLVADWNDVETTPAGSGVAISSQLNLQPGNDIWVFNGGVNNLNVYPPDADTQIDALGAGAPYVLVPGKLRCFMCWQATQFRSYGN